MKTPDSDEQAEKPTRFKWFHVHPKWLYLIIFAGFLLFHVFVFRDVITAIPSVLNGDSSIVREELVPFFDFGSQFWGEGTSALTSSEEVRVMYSFWTAWMRHYQVLPFAIVLLNTLSACILFYAFHRIGKYIYKNSLFGAVASVLATILIHTILLYAKMAHFYVLVIGFSMFALSLSLLCEQLFFKLKLSKKNIIAVSVLTLFNPAIHYHIIFYVVAAMIMIMHSLITLILNKKFFWKYFKRSFVYFCFLVLLGLVPYVFYIFLSSSSSIDGVATQIPVNYWMIYYASLSLPFIFSLDTAGHLDLIRYGNYLTPIPRFGSVIVTFLIGGIFLFKSWKSSHIVIRVFILTIFVVMLLAMWMTIGYSDNSPYSFHKVLGNVALLFAGMGNGIGSAIAGFMGTFINILRFPHRFQFIYFYAAGILFMIALVWLREAFIRKFSMRLASVFVILIALFPVIANNDYRTALTSGDFATFVTPYRIPNDLKAIKTTLSPKTDRKLFILPTLESGREIIQDGKRYSFLDKYLIYYLNKPTFYYGAGANTENKLASYLVYRAIAQKEKWWEYVLANNLGITDIVVTKNAHQRERGITYLPGIEAKIQQSLATATNYEKTYAGSDYELYSIKKRPDRHLSTLINMQWQNTLNYFKSDDKLGGIVFFPLQLKRFVGADGHKRLMTDSVERSFYDFYNLRLGKKNYVPNPISLPFTPQYVASSNFTNNTLSLSTLYAKNDDYNYLHENVPSLMNLQRPSFVGLTKGNKGLDVKVKVPENGNYRILLHAASKGDSVQSSIAGAATKLQKLTDDRDQKGDYVDFTYFYDDFNLKKGETIITIKNPLQNAILIDSVSLIPKADLPTDFARVTTPYLKITPTDDELIYDVRTE